MKHLPLVLFLGLAAACAPAPDLARTSFGPGNPVTQVCEDKGLDPALCACIGNQAVIASLEDRATLERLATLAQVADTKPLWADNTVEDSPKDIALNAWRVTLQNSNYYCRTPDAPKDSFFGFAY